MTTFLRSSIGILLLLAGAPGPALAASVPSRVNYQGVLRDAAGAPLTGEFDLTFRLYDAPTGGNEMLFDEHLDVIVERGLFAVEIGGGNVSDGAGPGVFLDLIDLFTAGSDIWLAVEVEGTLLDPRVPIGASPYAMQAERLEGREASEFLDTSPAAQSKAGDLSLAGALIVGGTIQILGGGPGAGKVLVSNAAGVGAWQEAPVGPNGRGSSITIGIEGLPIISYYREASAQLFFVRCTNDACTTSVVAALDGPVTVGAPRQSTSLAVPPDGRPIMTYHDAASGALKAAKCSNHLCTSATISVLEPFAGRVSSVTVGSDGLPVVAYYGAAGLRVRKCGDAQCLASTAVTLAAGLAPTDAVALGCGDMDMPVLTFAEAATGNLRYANCTNWHCVPWHRKR